MKYINKIKNSVLNFIQAENLTSPGDRILLSVSGGQDSVCMLDIIYNLRKKLNIDIAIGHINHQLRGEESEDLPPIEEYLLHHNLDSENHPFYLL